MAFNCFYHTSMVWFTELQYIIFNSVHCYSTCSNFQMEIFLGFEKMIFENKAVIATQQCI